MSAFEQSANFGRQWVGISLSQIFSAFSWDTTPCSRSVDCECSSFTHCITDADNWREGLTHSQGCSDKKHRYHGTRKWDKGAMWALSFKGWNKYHLLRPVDMQICMNINQNWIVEVRVELEAIVVPFFCCSANGRQSNFIDSMLFMLSSLSSS